MIVFIGVVRAFTLLVVVVTTLTLTSLGKPDPRDAMFASRAGTSVCPGPRQTRTVPDGPWLRRRFGCISCRSHSFCRCAWFAMVLLSRHVVVDVACVVVVVQQQQRYTTSGRRCPSVHSDEECVAQGNACLKILKILSYKFSLFYVFSRSCGVLIPRWRHLQPPKGSAEFCRILPIYLKIELWTGCNRFPFSSSYNCLTHTIIPPSSHHCSRRAPPCSLFSQTVKHNKDPKKSSFLCVMKQNQQVLVSGTVFGLTSDWTKFPGIPSQNFSQCWTGPKMNACRPKEEGYDTIVYRIRNIWE